MAELPSIQDDLQLLGEPGNTNDTGNEDENEGQIEKSTRGPKDTFHGNIFEMKLLTLFLVRGINAGYSSWKLGAEMSDLGGGFDDLVFYYTEEGSKQEKCRLLQAKHKRQNNTKNKSDYNKKQGQKKIQAANLFDSNDGDYSLAKYFKLFLSKNGNITTEKGNITEDLIIATNIGFDETDFEKKGIILKDVTKDKTDQILYFGQNNNGTQFKKYKIQLKNETVKKEVYENLKKQSESYLFAKKIVNCVISGEPMSLRPDQEYRNVFKKYHFALFNENILVKTLNNAENMATFRPEFFEEVEETQSYFFTAIKNEVKTSLIKWLLATPFIFKVSEEIWTKEMRNLPGRHKEENRNNLADAIADIMLSEENEKILDIINNGLIKEYSGALIKSVLKQVGDSKTKTSFKSDFLKNKRSKFRNRLEEKLQADWKKILKMMGPLKVAAGFGENPDNESKVNEGKLPTDIITDADIDSFFDKLTFAINTPDEIELGEVISQDISKHFGLLNVQFHSSLIFEKVLNWFKESDSKYIDKQEAKKILIDKVNDSMIHSRITNASLDYQQQELDFKEEEVEKDPELTTESLTSFLADECRFLWSITAPNEDALNLKAFQVCAVVKSLDERFKEMSDSFIIIKSSYFTKNKSLKNQRASEKLIDDKKIESLKKSMSFQTSLLIIVREKLTKEATEKAVAAVMAAVPATVNLKKKKVIIIGVEHSS